MRYKMESPLRNPNLYHINTPDRLSSPGAASGSYQGSPMSSMSFAVTPWDAGHLLRAIVSMGGAFQYFQLTGGSLGLGAEIPSHGCVSESHKVLVRVSLVR